MLQFRFASSKTTFFYTETPASKREARNGYQRYRIVLTTLTQFLVPLQ